MAWWDKIGEGRLVEKALAALPQTDSLNIFTVTGGRVIVTQLIGEVTTVIGNVPNSTHIQHTPTAGAAVDLCAAGNDIDSDADDTLYGMTGVPTDAMLDGLGAVPAQTQSIVLLPGAISVKCLGSDGGTGRVKWAIKYIPLDEGASVVAA